MTRVLLYITIALVSFGAGLVAIYMAMPVINPDGVEALRSRMDSVLVAEAEMPAVAESDSIRKVLLDPSVSLDSLIVGSDSVRTIRLEDHPRYAALIDSLGASRARATRLDEERARLITRLEALESAQAEEGAQRQDAAELSATLTRLEDVELQSILVLLDEHALERLYDEASGRSRTRILAELPSDRAARLVQRMLASNNAGVPPSDPGVQ